MPAHTLVRAGLVCLAMLVLPGAATAKVRAVIVQRGETEVGEPADPLGPEYQEHSLQAGHEVTFERFVNQADHVPAQLCRSFGFHAWLAGGPEDVIPDRILVRVSHPKLTRPDGVTSMQDTLMLPVTDHQTGTAFGFDEPWEVQPGDWTFDLVLDGEVIASQTFVATKPLPGSPLPHCPGRAVS